MSKKLVKVNNYTLCKTNNKYIDTFLDIICQSGVVTVEPVPSNYPVKGDIINIGSNTDDFRVMDIQGSTALLLNLTTGITSAYNTTSTTTTFDNGTTAQQYAGSTIDLAMSNYYDNLDSDIKSAIIPTNIKQTAASTATTSSGGANEWEYSSGKYVIYNDEVTVGTRNCFLLDIKDLENYFSGLTTNNYFESLHITTRYRSASATNSTYIYYSAMSNATVTNSESYNYPSFYIDLDNITYDYSYKTLTLKLANCSTAQNPITSRTGVTNTCIITPDQNYGVFTHFSDSNSVVYSVGGSIYTSGVLSSYNSQANNYELSYDYYSDMTLYVPMFEYYKIKFNNNNTYLEKDVENISNDVSVTFNAAGLPNISPITIDGINFTPRYQYFVYIYVLTISTTNHFWYLSDINVSGFNYTNIQATNDNTLKISVVDCTSSTPSITVNSHATPYNFKNKTIVLPLSSTESPKAWIGSYNGQGFNFDKYTPSGLGFTSNGTHFIGFYSDNDNSGGGTQKNPNSYWYYVNDNNERVKICTETNSGTATWESDAYKTLKFDNVNYYDSDLWKMLFIGNGATEQ